ncbi:hypothetical protein CCM_06601 [Cordyceps militaris CM01]|uniref:Uncharacterized protein n=1 Tax=Cordyceps militaris (strain CM01) TaxID=983644 RepID=G3JN00_CORMM|nr:uncharacterized protein CCM_06601 [Cordyceps militaris CM01]EGX90182.1 hypothetical protein CCM_06601 [Cordyceps militaris CM01]
MGGQATCEQHDAETPELTTTSIPPDRELDGLELSPARCRADMAGWHREEASPSLGNSALLVDRAIWIVGRQGWSRDRATGVGSSAPPPRLDWSASARLGALWLNYWTAMENVMEWKGEEIRRKPRVSG